MPALAADQVAAVEVESSELEDAGPSHAPGLEDVETWRARATILALPPKEPGSLVMPYRVVVHDAVAAPDTQAGAIELAAKWAREGVFVPRPDGAGGTFYPAHRVQAVKVYVVY